MHLQVRIFSHKPYWSLYEKGAWYSSERIRGDPWLRVIVKFAGCLWGGSNGPVECSNTVEEICGELESARKVHVKEILSTFATEAWVLALHPGRFVNAV